MRAWGVSQRLLALIALVVLSPVLLAIAAAVRLTSQGPALFRARRFSAGSEFTMLKFRTMRADTTGPALTVAGDRRVTSLGAWLRRTRLDELPQLWNVLHGEMLLVGPRPEDPRYVDLSTEIHRAVFLQRPGITGPTALENRAEDRSLARAAHELAAAAGRASATPDDIDRAYRELILPKKLKEDSAYLATRSVLGDIRILARTLASVFQSSG